MTTRIDALLTFLEPFNEYDREEYCLQFASIDPNQSDQLRHALDQQYFLDPWYSQTPLEEKRDLAWCLVEALRGPSFDFRWLIEDADGTFLLPSTWHISDYRWLFEQIYVAAFAHWNSSLAENGQPLPLPIDLHQHGT